MYTRSLLHRCVGPCLRQSHSRRWLHVNSTCVAAAKVSNILLKDEQWDLDRIRNIGIMAHIDAGKTTTTERMLYYAGSTRSLGDVDKGDTVTDSMELERERGITISSAAVTFYWNDHRINLIDTPGHVDFTVEVERSLRVLDGAVTILDASAGVEAQTLTVWRQARRFGIPSIIYLNKMDKSSAALEACLQSIDLKLQIKPVLLQQPTYSPDGTFLGVIDLVSLQRWVWPPHRTDGHEYTMRKVVAADPDNSQVQQAREQMLSTLAEADDAFANYVLNVTDVSSADVLSALRRATIHRKLVPVLCGSSVRNRGVQPLMNAVCSLLPAPQDLPTSKELMDAAGPNHLTALAFKIGHDANRGVQTFVRVYTGKLRPSHHVHNLTRDVPEYVAQVLLPFSNEMSPARSIGSGNIGVVTGLKHTKTGDCLVENEKAHKELEVRYAKQHANDTADEETAVRFKPLFVGIETPDPVFFCSIEPPSLGAQKHFDEALEQLQREDPSLRVRVDAESQQTILEGQGELHIEIVRERLKREYGLDVFLGPLQVNYREGITNEVEHTRTFDEIIGQVNHTISVTLRIQPLSNRGPLRDIHYSPQKGEEKSFYDQRKDWQHAVIDGCKAACRAGPILAYPVHDLYVTLRGFHASRKATAALVGACAEKCLTEAIQKAGCVLLEPIMRLYIVADADHVGKIISDLGRRRAEIEQRETYLDTCHVRTVLPLSEVVGYVSTLRSLTSGTGTFHMDLVGYRRMSGLDQAKLIERKSGVLS